MDASNFEELDTMTETTTIVCAHVFRNERQIEVVIHHSDGVWQLVCGKHDHPSDCSDFEVVGSEHLIQRQLNLASLVDLQSGWLAEWTSDGWSFSAHDD